MLQETEEQMLAKVKASVYERDLEFVAMIASGVSYAEIARVKAVSETTVRQSLYKCRDTIGVSKVAQVAILALKADMLVYMGNGKFRPNVEPNNGAV